MEFIKKYKSDVILICIIILLVVFHVNILKPTIVISESMLPTYKVGDIAYVLKIKSFDNIKVGDVVEYVSDNNYLISHRVISISDKGLMVKGDNNKKADKEYVTKENFRGKVVFRIPFIGTLIISFQKHMIAICMALYILFILGGKGGIIERTIRKIRISKKNR